MHEIITIQLGHYANFVGTHFWNLQESYFTYDEKDPSPVDHDIHFRVGLGVGNVETFTPRALIYDLKGGFGSLRKINQLYQDEADLAKIKDLDLNSLWSGKNETRETLKAEKNKFQQALDEGIEPGRLTDETVRYWSDFNRMFYHPRSSIQYNEYEHANPLTPFDSFDLGSQLFESSDKEEDILDRQFRVFAEECDLMQGLQVLTTVDDAWGGFATSYLDNLRDEYPKTTIWTWALERSEKTTRDRVLSRTAASVQSLIGMLPSCTTYIPINIPRPSLKLPSYVKGYEPASLWRTSALIATALETSILPSRLKAAGSRRTLAEVSTLLNANGNQQISTLRLNAVDENPAKSKNADRINFFPDPVDLSWGGTEQHIFAGLEVLRGIEKGHDSPQGPDATIKDSRESQCYLDLRFPVLSSFPDIFEPQKNTDESLGFATALRTSSSVVGHLKASQALANRIVPLDERETISNGLGELYEAYEEGWGSDSDDFYD
ncbi:mtDNA inheritance, partitioning of the mitochondrial organelle [Orbilia blumenaviensis]|uniref:MtDNA inheritance, partitioning of the mitochondrial organelle n=1 Tax=Orbilia blumenaviensis TaxID=1796055 RepID=A0AAV9UP17_9PEZI